MRREVDISDYHFTDVKELALNQKKIRSLDNYERKFLEARRLEEKKRQARLEAERLMQKSKG